MYIKAQTDRRTTKLKESCDKKAVTKKTEMEALTQLLLSPTDGIPESDSPSPLSPGLHRIMSPMGGRMLPSSPTKALPSPPRPPPPPPPQEQGPPSQSRLLQQALLQPHYQKYLQSLVAMPLVDISALPRRLEEEHRQLEEQLREVSFHEYRSFLKVGESKEAVLDRLQEISAQLDRLLPSSSSSSAVSGIEEAKSTVETEPSSQLQAVDDSLRNFVGSLQWQPSPSNSQRRGSTITNPSSPLSSSSPSISLRSLAEGKCAQSGETPSSLHQQLQESKLILRNYTSILDLLESVQLMQSLVDGGYFEEALDLDAFMHRLHLRYPHHPLLFRLRQEVLQVKQEMLQHLLRLLRTNLPLHLCLRVIGYLRRMQVFTEETMLKISFLQARSEYLWKSVIAGIPLVSTPTTTTTTTTNSTTATTTTNPTNPRQQQEATEAQDAFQYLKLFIDGFRTNFVDIVTQYQAIFASDAFSTGSSNSAAHLAYARRTFSHHAAAFDKPGLHVVTMHPSHDISSASILCSFVWHSIHRFLDVVRTHLQRIKDMSSLSYLLTQAMHFGVALGRKGMDIRFLVSALFEKRCQQLVEEIMWLGVQDFENELKWYGLANVTAGGAKNNATTATTTAPSATATPASSNFQAPSVLFDYPPLAALTNAYLQSFNALRVLPMVHLQPVLAQTLHTTFQSIATALLQLHREEKTMAGKSGVGGGDWKRNTWKSLLQVLQAVWAPYILRCYFDGVYGSMSFGFGGGSLSPGVPKGKEKERGGREGEEDDEKEECMTKETILTAFQASLSTLENIYNQSEIPKNTAVVPTVFTPVSVQ